MLGIQTDYSQEGLPQEESWYTETLFLTLLSATGLRSGLRKASSLFAITGKPGECREKQMDRM
jgi:hypothetical protein